MMKWIGILLVSSIAFFSSCTHPYEEEVVNTWDVNMSLSFIDPEFWPDGQQLYVGLFEEDDARNPIAQTNLNQPANNSVEASIYEVAEGSYNAQLYLTENGIYKVKVLDLGAYDVYDNINESIENIQLITYDRVQRQVFNNCVVCHGSSAGDIAAGLNLTPDNSYEHLVNVSAFMQPNMVLVYPNGADYSYLLKVLQKEIDFNHPASSSATEADRQLVEDWIEQGALNN